MFVSENKHNNLNIMSFYSGIYNLAHSVFLYCLLLDGPVGFQVTNSTNNLHVAISAISNSFEILNVFVTFNSFASIKEFTHEQQSL